MFHRVREPAPLALLLSVLCTTAVDAQAEGSGRAGRRPALPLQREIALARSAAPKEVSAAATIYTLSDTGYAVAVQGTNGNHCLVNRSWPESIEPHCFDPEAAATVMQMDLRRMSLMQRGATMETIERELADGLRNGTFILPRRPAMTYMMSSAQQLIGDDGQKAGHWHPHLMLFVPYLTSEAIGLGATPSTQAAMVVDSGKPLANIMVIVKSFVDPEGPPDDN